MSIGFASAVMRSPAESGCEIVDLQLDKQDVIFHRIGRHCGCLVDHGREDHPMGPIEGVEIFGLDDNG